MITSPAATMTEPAEMRRLRLTIAYDGRPWQGWQSQPGGLTVQDKLNEALSTIAKQPLSVEGSGRTDSGVHALAQIAHCDVPTTLRMEAHNWVRALNANLPASIRVTNCEFAAPDFHARFQAKGKIYRYRIWRADVMSPFEVGRAWHVYGELDVAALRRCADHLVGTHNFVRLSANRGDLSEEARRSDPEVTTRTIHRVAVTEQDDVLTFEIEGSGFLYKMVRMITGSLLHVARGRDGEGWFEDLLNNPAGEKSSQCALPDGLYLVRVKY
jgi:tRNA pseudouridine38-40 synthase